jgi:hypothetical protein
MNFQLYGLRLGSRVGDGHGKMVSRPLFTPASRSLADA